MSEASEVQRRLTDAWNDRDWETYRSLLHDDYAYVGADGQVQAGPGAGVRIGQKYAAAFPDGKVEITHSIESGNSAACEFTCRGTHLGELEGVAPSRRPVEIRVANFIEMRDGKVYREREYVDAMTIMVQIGAIPAPGSKTAAT